MCIWSLRRVLMNKLMSLLTNRSRKKTDVWGFTLFKQNPAYGRRQIPQPVRIVPPRCFLRWCWPRRWQHFFPLPRCRHHHRRKRVFIAKKKKKKKGWPIIGLKLIMWSEGQLETKKKLRTQNIHTQTFLLLDRIGPVGWFGENPAYWRQRTSWPMRIVAPIP